MLKKERYVRTIFAVIIQSQCDKVSHTRGGSVANAEQVKVTSGTERKSGSYNRGRCCPLFFLFPTCIPGKSRLLF